MTSRHVLGLGVALAATLLATACGSSVNVNPGGGGAGAGGAGAAAGSGGGGSTTGSTGSTSSGTGGAGGQGNCGALDEVGCLGAYPTCAPVYDDHCCPTCDPVGGCADCVDFRFHHCEGFATTCVADASCGFTPPWACQGGQADCAIDPGGSSTPCHSVAGCTAGWCPSNLACETDPVCTPVTKDACTSLCDAIPPPCPTGTTAQMDGFCYTGLCIAADLCGF